MRVSARGASLLALAALALAAGLYGIARGLREPAPPAPQGPAEAAMLYARYCAVCHGPTGKGDGPGTRVTRQPMRDFSDPAALREVDDRYYFAIIQKGGSQLGRSNAMPAWGMKLSDDEIRALVRYIRGLAAPASP
jgi:mono/diheme cytochrome c family protein